MFSFVLNPSHASVFVELEQHLDNLQLYILFAEYIFILLHSRCRWHLGVVDSRE